MHPSTRTTAITRLIAAAVVSSFVALVIAASPAAAHEGTAVITLESQTVEQMSVSYVMRAVWDNDGHAATDATATVVAETPTGERVGPVTMDPTDDDGRYAATLDFPAAGDWNVRFTVVTPPGTLEITQSIPDAGAATETAAAAAENTSSSATADTTASTDGAGVETAAASQTDRERPTSSASAALFFFIVAVIILGACTVAYRSRGKRRAQQQRLTNPRPTAAAATSEPADATDAEADAAEATATGGDGGNVEEAAAGTAAGVDTKDTPAE